MTCNSELDTAEQKKGVLIDKVNSLKLQIPPEMVTDKVECDNPPLDTKKRKKVPTITKVDNLNKKGKDTYEQTPHERKTEDIPFVGGGQLEKLDMCQSIPRHDLDNNPKLNPEEVSPPPLIPQC